MQVRRLRGKTNSRTEECMPEGYGVNDGEQDGECFIGDCLLPFACCIIAYCILTSVWLYAYRKKALIFSIRRLSNFSIPLCVKPFQVHLHKPLTLNGKSASGGGIHLISKQQQFFIKVIDGRRIALFVFRF